MEILNSSTTVATPPEALIKFCLLWTVLQRSQPPKVCNSVLDMDEFPMNQAEVDKVLLAHNAGILKRMNQNQNSLHHYNDDILDPSRDADNAFQFHFKHSSRSLSVIGVLGGIVLILFFVALSTCIKHRRNVNAFGERYHHRETLAREMLVDHIRQIRSNYRLHQRQLHSDRPPAYEDVVKEPGEEENGDGVDGAAGGGASETEEQPPSYIEATNNETSEEIATVVTVETNPRPT